ncbi:hypothetical protein [Curtobacterium sp. MCSS17_007]|uniref:hypothetical protein n=1 Tax=Curtobacterium sp. MCSS17_007 TaxID=2175646 RepID=UPI000DA8054D|nr:hypothetical protein [Curtobacterium sp. MCSS17_007]WIE75952.1 hypothetical protein DEJ22_001420 [Curtobacterium sp. MCSS17_007]
MVPGNYLPPYTADERASIAGDDVVAGAGTGTESSAPSGVGVVAGQDEVTYADFLGDQVPDDLDD